MRSLRSGVLAVLVAVLAACAPAAQGPGPTQSAAQQASGQPAPQPARTLSIVLRIEPTDLTTIRANYNKISVALFNATLAWKADRGPYPVLASELPQLGTDSWRVFPDGRMETVHRLRPGLIWHDGTALTAEDFAFGHRITLAKQQSGGTVDFSTELPFIEDVLAPDAQSVLIRWRKAYPEAANPLSVMPRPRHLLSAPLEAQESIADLTYWSTAYVGAGPYRLERWEPGAFLEAGAFEGYALGKPKIDRVHMTWSSDPNATLARLLAGDADIALDGSLFFAQAGILQREWTSRGTGVALLSPAEVRWIQVQFRPDYVNPPELTDVRVRKAIYHALDRKALAEALLGEHGIVAEILRPPTVAYYSAVEGAATKYPYDLRRTAQLMTEAGFERRPDGSYARPAAGTTFTMEVRGIGEGQEAQETTIVANDLQQAGLSPVLNLVPAAMRTASAEFRSTFPALTTNYQAIGEELDKLLLSRVGTRENQFSGGNRGGWANPEYDRLYDAYYNTLEPTPRTQHLAQLLALISTEVPVLPMYFNLEVVAHTVALRGPRTAEPDTTRYWDIHEWRWQ